MKQIQNVVSIIALGISAAFLCTGCGGSDTAAPGQVLPGATTGSLSSNGSTTGGATTAPPGSTGGLTSATTTTGAPTSTTTGSSGTGGSTGSPLTYTAAVPSSSGLFTGDNAQLQFTLTPTKAVYATGEPVGFTFTVTNQGQQNVTTLFGGVEVDYQVIQGNNVIWWDTRSPGFGGAAGGGVTPPLAPGQSSTGPETWPQTDMQGNSVPPGQYTLVAWWTPATINGSVVDNSGQTRTDPGPIAALLGAKPVTVTVQ